MSAILDVAKFSFAGELLKGTNELLFDEVVRAPQMAGLHTIFTGIKTKKEVGFVGEAGLLGKAYSGCDPQPQPWNIGTRKVIFDPVRWEVLLHMCVDDLENTIVQFELKSGLKRNDFTTTDYMNIVTGMYEKSMVDFFMRFAWFSDTDAENVATGGIIKDGADVGYFNLIDGFWKQMQAQYAVNASQRIAVVENTKSTYAHQVLSPSNAKKYLESMLYGAPITLRQQEGLVYMVTQSFYDAYERSLSGTQLEIMYRNMVDGQRKLSYNGIPLMAIPFWDKTIRSYEDVGAKYNNPHRAVLTTKAALGIALDGTDDFSNFNVRYDMDSRKVKVESMGMSDAKLLNPQMFQIAI